MTRTAATITVSALLLATLTGCSSNSGTNTDARPSKSAAARPTPTPTSSINCSDSDLSQADWVEHCADQAKQGKLTGLHFGQTFTWDDGVTVTVTEARVFTDYDTELGESAKAGETDFRVMVKVVNDSFKPVDLGTLSTIVEGATNGGEASGTEFENGSEPMTGRVGPGVTVTKTNDNVLESKYGRKVVVTVQRTSDTAATFDFPEFTGSITG